MTDTFQKIIFVGGAPRSGTTVTHALLCTSEQMNPYHSEISYVTPMVRSYLVGLDKWNSHTLSFFEEKEHFRLHVAGLVGQTLNHISKVFDNPDILCVKDPLLTPLFPQVSQLFPKRARLVTVIRHPYAVVRSRQEVARKAGLEYGLAGAAAVCREYNESYRHLDNPALKDVLMYFRYEDILNEDVLENLRTFTGCPDISTQNVWGQKDSAEGAASTDPWFSPKYHKPINVDNRLDDLDMSLKAVTDEHCGPLMERFDYTQESLV